MVCSEELAARLGARAIRVLAAENRTGSDRAPDDYANHVTRRVSTIAYERAGIGPEDIDLAEVDFAYVAGVGENPVEDALNLFSRIGPAAPALRALEGIAQERALGWMRDWLEQHRSGNLVALGAAATRMVSLISRRTPRRSTVVWPPPTL